MVAKPIFICHSSKNWLDAQRLCEEMEKRGLPCWISTRDIAPGENFQEAIVKAIRAARVMILIFSDESNRSTEVKKEVALASQSQLFVIPARFENIEPSDGLKYELATRQWIDLFDDWNECCERLAQHVRLVLDQVLDAGSHYAAPTSRISPRGNRRASRWPKGIATAIAALAIFLIAVFLWQGRLHFAVSGSAGVVQAAATGVAAAPSDGDCSLCPPMSEITTQSGSSVMISRGHITVTEWRNCETAASCRVLDSGTVDGNLPVTGVSWREAVGFAQWLSAKTGRKFRLPTEAEWEGVTRGALGPDNGQTLLASLLNFGKLAPETASSTDRSRIPALIIGVAGSVADWLGDCRSPEGADAFHCQKALIRGSSWRSHGGNPLAPGETFGSEVMGDAIGFRLVLEQ
jgi:hypothetical protein